MQTTLLYLLAIWLFYVCFASAISVYRLWVKGTLNLWNKVLYSPLLIGFFLVDALLNYTALLALGFPPSRCFTMSDRFQVYHTGMNLDGSAHAISGFQKDVGTFICEKLLNPIDPTGNHC